MIYRVVQIQTFWLQIIGTTSCRGAKVRMIYRLVAAMMA
jgi:hypothetical protein